MYYPAIRGTAQPGVSRSCMQATDVTQTIDKNDPIFQQVQACAALALDKKATDPVVLAVADLTSFADFFLIASAPSERQVAAIASHIEDTMRKAGVRPLSVEGKSTGAWVLLDFGDFVVHLFHDSAREYYDLEGFWADAERVEIDEDEGLAFVKQAEQKKSA